MIPDQINGIPVTRIGQSAFAGTPGLSSVTFGYWNPVRSIGAEAFRKCVNLKEVHLPRKLLTLGSLAFNRCDDGLFDTTTVPGVKLVDGWVVESDESLSGFLDLSGVRGIAGSAFNGRTGLSGMTLPDGMETICDYTFGGCSGLTHLTIPSSVKNIGKWAFAGCEQLSGTLTLPSGLRCIGYLAFSDCKRLTGATIPDSVTSVESSAFSGCESMASFVVGSGNENYKSVSGLLLSKDGEKLVSGINGDVIIPDGVTEIDSYAFQGRSGLTNVVFPESTRYIGLYAFYNCRNLSSVAIPANLWSIGQYAFSQCASLTEIHFEGNSPTIWAFAFDLTPACVYVKQGSTGWDVDIPGVWNGHSIVYEDGPAMTITVTYDANGGDVTPEPVSFESGSAIGPLPTTTRDGYTFTGWWTSPDGDGTQISNSTIVTESATYYARWEADGGDDVPDCLYTAIISFGAGGGDGWMPSKSAVCDRCNTDTYYALPSCDFSRPGYAFAGWRVRDSCYAWDGDESSLPVYSEGTYYGPLCGDLELTATWEIDGGHGAEGLLHRWSFNGDLTDSVGGRTAVAVGNVSTDGSGYITESAGSGGSYISLGSDILPAGDQEATVEMWVTRTGAADGEWNRIFEIGSGPEDFTFNGLYTTYGIKNESTNSISVCWPAYGSTHVRAGIKAWSATGEIPMTESGTEYHLAVVYQRDGATWQVSYFCLDTTGNVIGRYTIAHDGEWSPSNIGRTMCVLSQALTGWDSSAGAKYNEFRVWNRALTLNDLVANDRNGPDSFGDGGMPSVCTVTYTPGAYGIGSGWDDEATQGETFLLPGYAAFTRSGYTQTGWSTDYYGSTKDYDLGATYTANALNIWLYPYWQSNDPSCLYTAYVSFYAGGGDGWMESDSVDCNTCDNNTYYTLPSCGFTRTGYTFAGWRVRDSCYAWDGNESSLPVYAAGTSYGPLSGNLDLTATWEEVDIGAIYTATANGLTWRYAVVNGEAMIFGGKQLEWDDEEGRETWEHTPAIPQNTSGAIMIPSSLGGFPVTAIGDGAFTGCERLTVVTIPYGVKTIGEEAFIDCVRLSRVSFPEGLLSIGDAAFESCALTSVSLPLSLISLGRGSFAYCGSLQRAYLPVRLYSAVWNNEVFYNTTADLYFLDEGATPPAQPDPLKPWTAKKAVKLRGAVYDGTGNIAGIVELKIAKPNAKKRNVKVSGSVMLLDGKKRSVKAQTVSCDGTSTLHVDKFTAKGLAPFSIEIGADGFSGGNESYTLETAEVGGKWTREAGVDCDWEDGNLPAGTLVELLPAYEELKPKNGKWFFPKGAKVKYGKLKTGGVGLTVDTSGGKTNLSAMKLTYTPKTGIFKGSFKIYAVQGGKLKKFTVKVFGFVVEGTGVGRATLAKPKTTWWLQVE